MKVCKTDGSKTGVLGETPNNGVLHFTNSQRASDFISNLHCIFSHVQIGARRCHDPEETECLLPQLGSGPFSNNSGQAR